MFAFLCIGKYVSTLVTTFLFLKKRYRWDGYEYTHLGQEKCYVELWIRISEKRCTKSVFHVWAISTTQTDETMFC